MAKKVNPWIAHMAKTRKANPKITDFKKIASIAKKTYKSIKKVGGNTMVCKTPGRKIRSKGRGLGLARGKGRGPINRRRRR